MISALMVITGRNSGRRPTRSFWSAGGRPPGDLLGWDAARGHSAHERVPRRPGTHSSHRPTARVICRKPHLTLCCSSMVPIVVANTRQLPCRNSPTLRWSAACGRPPTSQRGQSDVWRLQCPPWPGPSWCRLNGSQRDCPGSGTALRLALREPTGPPSIPSDLVGATGFEPVTPHL
jgi:hypothetical protein